MTSYWSQSATLHFKYFWSKFKGIGVPQLFLRRTQILLKYFCYRYSCFPIILKGLYSCGHHSILFKYFNTIYHLQTRLRKDAKHCLATVSFICIWVAFSITAYCYRKRKLVVGGVRDRAGLRSLMFGEQGVVLLLTEAAGV